MHVVGFYEAWRSARDSYVYEVDLRRFKDAAKHPGFFDRQIRTDQIEKFESSFRFALVPDGRVERAAEVAYWKNAKNYKARDLMEWINGSSDWLRFTEAIHKLAHSPTWEQFQRLVGACGQTSGFATPLTFLSFYDPMWFPMVDRRTGTWWSAKQPGSPGFTWNRDRTVISPAKGSWQAYLAWTEFCRRHAAELTAFGGMHWRARDVEMAVWTDTDAKLPLIE
jgi:hypothetical protein